MSAKSRAKKVSQMRRKLRDGRVEPTISAHTRNGKRIKAIRVTDARLRSGS